MAVAVWKEFGEGAAVGGRSRAVSCVGFIGGREVVGRGLFSADRDGVVVGDFLNDGLGWNWEWWTGEVIVDVCGRWRGEEEEPILLDGCTG